MELALSVGRVIESPSPVNSKKTDHREEYSHADTGRPLDVERIKLSDIRPAVTSFKEDQSVNRGLRLKHNRVTEFNGELVIDVSGICIS